MGPLPVTKSGHRYILTMLCPATKYPEVVSLKELSSIGIVDALLTVFTRIGFPAEIQSDHRSVFTSMLSTTFFEKCVIRIVHSSVCHPESNSVKKWHSVLKRVLRALCYEHESEWVACLPDTMFALRTIPHEATSFSPADLVYGRSPRSPLGMIRELWEGKSESSTIVEYVLQFLDRLHRTSEFARASMEAAQKRAKRCDKTARLRTFGVGDRVVLLRPSKQNKLEVQWEGPADVVEKLSDTNYALRMRGRRKEVRIYHSKLMKPYWKREAVVNMTFNMPEEDGATFSEFTDRKADAVSI